MCHQECFLINITSRDIISLLLKQIAADDSINLRAAEQKEITSRFVYYSLISLTENHFPPKWLMAPCSGKKKKLRNN